jgi:hypothetical protein
MRYELRTASAPRKLRGERLEDKDVDLNPFKMNARGVTLMIIDNLTPMLSKQALAVFHFESTSV